MTAHHVTSLPVPAVEGIQISGKIECSNSTSPHSTVVFPFVTLAATAFAWSIADPPPKAMMASTFSSIATFAIASQSSALGLGFTFVSNKYSIPSFSKLSFNT